MMARPPSLIVLGILALCIAVVSGGKCKETDVDCATLAERGECSSPVFSPWMLINCPMSCKLCNRWPASGAEGRCSSDQFTCGNEQCMQASWRCDGEEDCGDGTDEQDCHLVRLLDWPVNHGVCNDSNSCENGANCTDVSGGHACLCAAGFRGPSCREEWAEECEAPCEGEDCDRLRTKMTGLLDMTADPCQDFFRFACSVAGPGNEVPPVPKPLATMKQLVKRPPDGYEYVNEFYQSCVKISTGYTSMQVLFFCREDGICDDDKLVEEKYGKVYVDFINYLKQFGTKTAFPVVTLNWEEVTNGWFKGQGWNWWDFAAYIMKDYFFLGSFQYTSGDDTENLDNADDIFKSSLFFAPMIETTFQDRDKDGEGDILPRINIVPMRVSRFLRNGGNNTELKVYKKLMMALLGYLSNNATSLEKDIDRIVELELEVGKINTKAYFKDADFKAEVTIQQLHNMVPTVEWKDYIQASLAGEFKVKRYTKVNIPSTSLMKKMGKWVKNISKRDQANLLIWRMMVTFANNFMHTDADATDLQNNIFSQIDPNATTRAENCVTQIKTFFPGVEDDMLIAKYIDKESKAMTAQLWEEIKDAFKLIIKENIWMAQSTKVRAIEKLNNTRFLLGELLPKTPEFEILKSNMSDDYIGNILNIGNYKGDTLSKSLVTGKTSVLRGYEEDNNAYNIFASNAVRIKTGYIRNLLGLGFSRFYPTSVLYGSMMALLGHELTHGFDSNGRKYDKDGLLLDWWEPEDDAKFKEKTQCMVDQYKTYKIPYQGRNYSIDYSAEPKEQSGSGDDFEEESSGVDDACMCECGNQDYCEALSGEEDDDDDVESDDSSVSGTRDPAENISDNGGVRMAYRAFQLIEGRRRQECVAGLPFSARQLFWVSYAVDWCSEVYTWPYSSLLNVKVGDFGHSPVPWRVNVVLGNMPEFAQDFHCPAGARMRPADTCTVW